jgi:hypothetical protein
MPKGKVCHPPAPPPHPRAIQMRSATIATAKVTIKATAGGQGPNQRRRRGGHPQKQSANTAKESDGQETNCAFIMTDLVSIAQWMGIPPECHGAIIDSSVTSHFCPDRTKFTNFISITPQDIYTANGSVLSTTRKGDVKIDLPLGKEKTSVTLRDALYAPSMAFMLIFTN